MLNIKKIIKVVSLSGILLFSSQSSVFASTFQAQGTTTSPVGNFPAWNEVYTSAQLTAAKCDQSNLEKMFNDAKTKWDSEKKQIRQYAVEKQVLATPKAATNKMLSCVDGAMNAINSVANGIDSILGILSGNVPWGAIGSAVMDQLTQLACNQLDGYLTGVVNDVSGGFMGTINDVNNTVNGGVNLNTGMGNVNLSGSTIYNKGTSTTATDAVKGLTK